MRCFFISLTNIWTNKALKCNWSHYSLYLMNNNRMRRGRQHIACIDISLRAIWKIIPCHDVISVTQQHVIIPQLLNDGSLQPLMCLLHSKCFNSISQPVETFSQNFGILLLAGTARHLKEKLKLKHGNSYLYSYGVQIVKSIG